MKILYIWHSEPKRKRVYDTEEALKRNPFRRKLDCTQEEWDKQELERFERDKKLGKVLEYKVIG